MRLETVLKLKTSNNLLESLVYTDKFTIVSNNQFSLTVNIFSSVLSILGRKISVFIYFGIVTFFFTHWILILHSFSVLTSSNVISPDILVNTLISSVSIPNTPWLVFHALLLLTSAKCSMSVPHIFTVPSAST